MPEDLKVEWLGLQVDMSEILDAEVAALAWTVAAAMLLVASWACYEWSSNAALDWSYRAKENGIKKKHSWPRVTAVSAKGGEVGCVPVSLMVGPRTSTVKSHVICKTSNPEAYGRRPIL